MQKAFVLLRELQDGRAHSGERLAEKLEVSRTAVWHHIKRLREFGLDIHAVSGKGYRLPYGYEFLNADQILENLPLACQKKIHALVVETMIDSTNERLLVESQTQDVHGHVRLAEFQTAGRGRRGASWLAPPGSGLCLSLAWRFNQTPASIGALSLVVGIALARASMRLGAKDIAIKWPNDLYLKDAERPCKIAGILIEMRSELTGPSMVVIGIGLNLHLSQQSREKIDQPVSDLSSARPISDERINRNLAGSTIIEELLRALGEFEQTGFAGFQQEWATIDLLKGRNIRLILSDKVVSGIAAGVDSNGMLIVENAAGKQAYLSGHIEFAN